MTRRSGTRRRLLKGGLRALLLALLLMPAAITGATAPEPHVSQTGLSNAFRFPHFPRRDYRRLPPIPSGGVLVGSNYSHYRFHRCRWTNGGVLTNYGRRGVARTVHRQLEGMRRHGVQSLRTIVWYMTDPGPNRWGPVPSAGGRLPQPYRDYLIAYLREVSRLRFKRLTISFGPQWRNSPIEANYSPAKFLEDWHFIEDVRSLVKRYGPRETRFDLLNEGAPSDYLPASQVHRMIRFDRRMYSLYVHRYGSRDVTISVIAAVGFHDNGRRLQNLINLIRGTGLPEPRWFDLHAMLGYNRMLHALRKARAVLRNNHINAPIVIGEAPYNNPGAAAAIAQAEQEGADIQEVLEWYHDPHAPCNVSPPYSVSAYGAQVAEVTHS